jgi:hypothetical protein
MGRSSRTRGSFAASSTPVPLALDGGPPAAEHRLDDRQRLLEPVETVGERAELEAELPVLELEPPGADAEHRPPTADDVERGDGLREQRRVAVRVSRDQRGELDPLGARREGAEQRVRLEHRLGRFADAGQLVEVVHDEDGVEAGLVRLAGLLCHGGEDPAGFATGVREVRDLVAKAYTHSPTVASVTSVPRAPSPVRR